jgi:hypothetical protein
MRGTSFGLERELQIAEVEGFCFCGPLFWRRAGWWNPA